MLTTDAELDIAAHGPAFISADLHQLANPVHIDRDKRIGFVNLCLLIGMHEVCRIIPADAKSGLGEIIGPSGTFAEINDIAKWMLSAGMLLGRLELFSVLVLFLPNFWQT